jgi:hypothetical protein
MRKTRAQRAAKQTSIRAWSRTKYEKFYSERERNKTLESNEISSRITQSNGGQSKNFFDIDREEVTIPKSLSVAPENRITLLRLVQYLKEINLQFNCKIKLFFVSSSSARSAIHLVSFLAFVSSQCSVGPLHQSPPIAPPLPQIQIDQTHNLLSASINIAKHNQTQ